MSKKSQNITHVVMIIDKSGSMGPLAADVIGGFNSYLDELEKESGNFRVSCTLFDTNFVILYKDKLVNEADRLDEFSYQPQGYTAMYDAIGTTLAELPEFPTSDKVIVVIQTDGKENSSRYYSVSQIKEKIDERANAGWLFMYLGVGPSTWEDSSRIGISADQTRATVADSIGTWSSYAGLAASATTYHQTGDADAATRAYDQTPGATDPQHKPRKAGKSKSSKS